MRAVLLVAALVALVLVGMNFPIADALWGGPYGLTSSGGKRAAVWRMNQRTGQVSFCLFQGGASAWEAKSPTPRQTARITPRCSPWGPATER